MKLSELDGKCVRITTVYGEAYEGYCSYNNEDFCEHAFGRWEESLEILDFLFFKSEIKAVESLENNDGPYGHFTEPYGLIEKLTAEEGEERIAEVLQSDEQEHIKRLLIYLESRKTKK